MVSRFWQNFLDFLQKDEKNRFLINVLKQTKPVSLTDTSLSLGCENVVLKNYLEKKASEIERNLLIFNNQRLRVVFVLTEKKKTKQKEEKPLFAYENNLSNLLEKANVDERYRLENFAVSSSNQVAFAASQAVSERLGKVYNPLFIYGDVGVGKTHLACAIARKVLEKNQKTRVYYCPGDQFTNELIEAIRNKSTPSFRKKYRSLNLLCVDDIQFIAGKQTVQEEFFHTFNSIIKNKGQVVLVSDRPPNEIKKLEERLRSRFSGGLIVDIQPPDFELRTVILLIKAKEKNIEIDINAAKVIAETITDARSLEGTLLSIYAKMVNEPNQNKKIIDIEEVEKYFHNNQQLKKIKKIDPEEVVKSIASYFNLKYSQLKSASRSNEIARARQITMFVLRNKLNLKLEHIARILKRKDHTTIIHGINKILHLTTTNPLFKKEVDQIIQVLDL